MKKARDIIRRAAALALCVLMLASSLPPLAASALTFGGPRPLHVLDIEPRTAAASSLTVNSVRSWLPEGTDYDIRITHMSVAEFIGHEESLEDTCDLIYIGSSTDNIPAGRWPNSTDAAYNNTALNGLVYTAEGDSYGSAAFSPFDLTEEKRDELTAYARAGYPVVTADDLLTVGNTVNFEVEVSAESYVFNLITVYTAAVTFDPAHARPNDNSITYQWYSEQQQYNGLFGGRGASLSTFLELAGFFQCAVTVNGSTAYSRAINYDGEESTADAHPVSGGSFTVDPVVHTARVQSGSNMHRFLTAVGALANVTTPTAAAAGRKAAIADPRLILSDISGERPVEYPTEITPYDGVQNLYYNFYIDGVAGNNHSCALYIDSNLNGDFEADERATGLSLYQNNTPASSSALSADTVYSLTCTLPYGTAGRIPWRLEIMDDQSGRSHGREGLAYIRPPAKSAVSVLWVSGGAVLDFQNDAALSGAIQACPDYTIQNAAAITGSRDVAALTAACDVMVLSSNYAVGLNTADAAAIDAYIASGAPVVYAAGAGSPAASQTLESSYYIMLHTTAGRNAYGYFQGISTNANAYTTNAVSRVNTGSLVQYPYDLTGTSPVTLAGNRAISLPQPRLELEPNVTVWYCLADTTSNQGVQGNAYSTIPNDCINDYFIYSVDRSVYFGMELPHDLSADGARLLVNSLIYAAGPRSLESSVSFVRDYTGTREAESMSIIVDEDGSLDAPGDLRLYFKVETTEPTTYALTYSVSGEDVPIVSGGPVPSGVCSYPLTAEVLTAAATGSITVTITLGSGVKDTLPLRPRFLLPLG